MHEQIMKHAELSLVDLYDVFCDEECILENGGKPLYNDTNHLSVTGSELVGRTIRDLLK